jgi:hypothetical protein
MFARPKGSKNKPKYPEHVKYREDIVEEWLLLIAGGRTMNEIYNGNRDRFPHPATVGQWLIKHDDFYEKFMKAKRVGAEIDADYIRYIADSCDESSTGAVQKARLQVDTRMKILSKLLPGTYGERVQVEQTIDDKRSLDQQGIDQALADVEKKFFKPKNKEQEETVQ